MRSNFPVWAKFFLSSWSYVTKSGVCLRLAWQGVDMPHGASAHTYGERKPTRLHWAHDDYKGADPRACLHLLWSHNAPRLHTYACTLRIYASLLQPTKFCSNCQPRCILGSPLEGALGGEGTPPRANRNQLRPKQIWSARIRLDTMGRLRLVASLKLFVSFAKEPYSKRDDILQQRLILRSLLIVATP